VGPHEDSGVVVVSQLNSEDVHLFDEKCAIEETDDIGPDETQRSESETDKRIESVSIDLTKSNDNVVVIADNPTDDSENNEDILSPIPCLSNSATSNVMSRHSRERDNSIRDIHRHRTRLAALTLYDDEMIHTEETRSSPITNAFIQQSSSPEVVSVDSPLSSPSSLSALSQPLSESSQTITTVKKTHVTENSNLKSNPKSNLRKMKQTNKKQQTNVVNNHGSDRSGNAEETTRRSRSDPTDTQSSLSTHSRDKKTKKQRSKKDFIKEIVTFLDSRLLEQEGGGYLLTFLQQNGCIARIRQSQLYNSIEWYRRPPLNSLNAQHNSNGNPSVNDNDITDEEIITGEKVNFVAFKFTANDFATLIEKGALMQHTDYASELNPKSKIIYILEGLDEYLKETTRLLQQNYRHLVLKELNIHTQHTQQQRQQHSSKTLLYNNNNNNNEIARVDSFVNRLTKEQIEAELLKLQIEKQCFIRQTNNLQDTAECIYKFTVAIAERPYRIIQPAFETFCAEVSRSSRRAATTVNEAWIEQLEQIHSVSRSVAEAIARQYPTPRSLFDLYLSGGLTEREKQNLLADIRVDGRGGTVGRRIGPTLSKKIYHVFTETNGDKFIN
jgi:hypothetical protein